MTRPILATYRLQLRPGFGFAEAREVVPYLARLGVSHLYLSPCFEAAEGSTHGYDVVDPNRLRADLGGEEGFDALVATAHEHDLGIVLDIVPHHMAATADNAWWWSVLELGERSPYGRHFDIDWNPPEARLRGSVLLPVLGDHYGRVLESGELHLERGKDDQLVARYYDNVAPLSPDTADELWAIAGRRGTGIDDVLAEVNADVDRLDALLDRQHHRFARWQVAAHELDYRRFFDIDTLVALRSERPEVFDDTHRLALSLVREGKVDGLRVDHVDGLRDPLEYTQRLRAGAPGAWIVIEKILRPDEHLPEDWEVDGSTGYDFLAETNRVLADGEGVRALTDAYLRFTGDDRTYEEVRLAARGEILDESLDADLERVVALLVKVCERQRRWRDFTRAELRDALREVTVHVAAYRAYVRPGTPVRDDDRRLVEDAIRDAGEARTDLDADLLDLLSRLFLGELRGPDEDEAVLRWQQLTGPVTAKGEEDTAFYRWVPFVAANEVGGEPDVPSSDVAEFHERMALRSERWPRAMLTTSTHDTKRSEDVRARLAVLSEIPGDFVSAVHRWSTANERSRDRELDAPDRVDEWFVYQTLVGAHPLPGDRAWAVLEKSMREAKRRTSWTRQDDGYENGVRRFVESILADEAFLAELDQFVAPLVEPGRVNALAQVALRLLGPGVPDTYQGCELWDLSLVDPDNRRPVDYDARVALLDRLDGTTAAELWAGEQDTGAPKLALVRTCLDLRRRHGDRRYEPIEVVGADRDDVIAFRRGDGLVVAVPRRPLRATYLDATVAVPDGRWRAPLTGTAHDGGRQSFLELRGAFPVAVLEREP